MRLFRTISPRALKPGPKPDPALRARDPKWFRRGRAVNGPENYDPLERRFYGGRPAKWLALCAADQAALARGHIRPGAGERFTEMTQGFVNALWIYMQIKRALYLILCPFRSKVKARQRLHAHPRPEPKSRPPKRLRPLSERDWHALDKLYGFDVRMTSPTHIIARAKRLRVMLWAETPDIKVADVCTIHATKARKANPKIEPEDLFMVWPPVALPNLPRGTKTRARNSFAAIRAETCHTPQPKPLSLVSLTILQDTHRPDQDTDATFKKHPDTQAQPRAGPKKDVTEQANCVTAEDRSGERYV